MRNSTKKYIDNIIGRHPFTRYIKSILSKYIPKCKKRTKKPGDKDEKSAVSSNR